MLRTRLLLSAAVAATAVAGAGCLRDGAVTCADGVVCPVATVCHPRGCVPLEQAQACDGLADGAPCRAGLIDDGVCDDGVCLAAGCGNQVIEPGRGERCDDGNQVDGDGCAATCDSTQVCGNGLLDPYGGEACDDAGVLGGDGCSSRCRLEEAAWTRVRDLPIGRRWGGVSHDVHADELVLFGGDTNADVPVLLGDTWSWRDGIWRAHLAPVAPAARTGTSMVYDQRRRVHVLFGGRGANALYNDTWEWDGATWRRPQAGNAPSARHYHAMVYDSTRGAVLLVGGADQDGVPIGDTWSWDGQRWRQHPTPADLTPRVWASIADDPARGRVVMVGGQTDFSTEPTRLAETWEWDGQAWTQAATSAPTGGVVLAATRFIPARGRVVMIGGVRAATGAAGTDLFEWDGTSWSSVGAGVFIAATHGFVDRADRLHLVAGLDASDQPVVHLRFSPGATLDPGAMIAPDASTTAASLPRLGHIDVVDGWRGRRVVWGGIGVTAQVSDEAWVQDRDGWRFDPTAPPGRIGAAATFDPRRGEVVVFGGHRQTDQAETWRWDGSGWHAFVGAEPSARTEASMAWDEVRGRVLMFGGRRAGAGEVYPPGGAFPLPAAQALDDLWAWDGTSWTEVSPSGPRPAGRWGAGLAFDPTRDRLVLFAGQSATDYVLGDLWEFDGSRWTEVAAGQRPVARAFPALGYDPWRRRVVASAGISAGVLDDVWEWDGLAWQVVEPAGARPFGRGVHTLSVGAVDGDPGVSVFGGFFAGPLADEWRLAWTASHRAEVCTSGADLDGDGLGGCADPDCWTTCDPTCGPGRTCEATRPRCGDGSCSAVESCATCAADCGACPARCGDARCDGGEACPGDCGS